MDISANKNTKYLTDSLKLVVWLVLRAAALAILVILQAKFFSTVDYGLLVTSTAIASMLTPLSGLGFQHVLVYKAAKEPLGLGDYCLQTLRIWVFSTSILCLAASVYIVYFTTWPVAPSLICLFVTSEIICNSFTDLSARIFQVKLLSNLQGFITASSAATKLLTFALFSALLKNEISTWMMAQTAINLVVSITLFVWALLPQISRRNIVGSPIRYGEGATFVIASIAPRIQAEFNKPLLANVHYEDSGKFNIAQRVIDLFSIPLTALQETLWPRLYAKNDHKSMMLAALVGQLAIAVLLGVIIVYLAPKITLLLGEKYSESAILIAALAGLPSLQVLRSFAAVQHVATGHNLRLSKVYIFATIFTIIETSLLIHHFQIQGAIAAAYTAEFAFIAALLISLAKKRTNDNRNSI